MSQEDFKTWNSTIKSLCIDARHNEALLVFHRCLQGSIGFKPDHQVFSAILKSCTALLAAKLGKALHSVIVKQGHVSCHVTSKALLNMYAKWGAFDECQKLFVQLSSKDHVVWNIVLSGFSVSMKHDAEVMRTIRRMHGSGDAKPNDVTIATVLPVCARLRDVEAGKSAHAYVIKSGYETNTLAGNALVSFYAKCGLVSSDAYAVFNKIDSNNIRNYVVMSKFYAADARWDGVMEIRRMMRNKDMKKPAGCSWIEVDRTNNIFVVGDCSHPQRSIIYSTLHILDEQIKEP